MAITTEWTVPAIGRVAYSGLSSDTKPTKPTAPAGSEFHETDTKDTYITDGTNWVKTKQDGAAHVLGDLGTGFGIAQNRYDSGVTTSRRKITFPDGTGPTKIVVRLNGAAAGEMVHMVINSISDQHADNELVDPASQDAGTERFTIFDSAVQPQGLEISSITPMDRMDYIMPADAGSAVLIVEGA